MEETGLIKAIKKRNFGENDEKFGIEDAFQLSFLNVSLPFIVVVFGIGLAMMLAFIEFLAKKPILV